MATESASLIDLLSRYSEQHSRRSRGGLGTIAGIDFQLRCFLADFVSELARGTNIEEAGRSFLEAFSDYSRVETGGVVCVQVKRTLTKTKLAEAAEEAVIIDEFFEREAKKVWEQFRFEVVGLIGKSDGSAPSWDGVQLRKDLEDRQSRQQRFEQMLAAGRFQPSRIEPDPWWRIVAAAWSVLDDPFAFAREALEICLRRGIAPIEAERIRNEIAEAFKRREKTVRLPGRVVAIADVELNPSQSQEVVLGQPPTLADVRDGRFMDRLDHVADALAELDRHVAKRDWHRDPYVYAFSVEGRSGNGKSVLLLQLMRQLVRERGAWVIWLDDASEELLPLLEASIAGPAETSGLCYVFVDDFYAPNKRAGIDFRKIDRLLREHHDRTDWPVLVTCAPPEQHKEWKTNGHDQSFRIATWRLPPALPGEQTRLKGWFRNRTGDEPTTGRAFEKDHGLMLSMMFEMRKGEMREFGHRFRSRLESLDLVSALTLPLALNRLYIWAPGGWLDEAENDALRLLNQDQDFSILTLSGRAGKYVRITHPHLSDVVYQSVREGDDQIVRARDLHQAFAGSLKSDPTTARLLLYRVAENHERLAILDENELARGMTDAWQQFGQDLAEFDAASMWADWAVWNARQPVVQRHLGTEPLERAREALSTDHPYWGVVWEKLWTSKPGHVGLIEDAETWLASDPARQHRHWSFVWERLFEYKKDEGLRVDELETSATNWLRDNEYEPDWNFVFQPIATTAPSRLPWDSAVRLIDEYPTNRNWPYVFGIVLDRPQAFDVERHRKTLNAGWQWLCTPQTQDTAEWSYVWEKLVDLRGDLPAEIDRAAFLMQGHAWLEGREDSAEWSYVWRKLVDLRGELPAEIDRAAFLMQGHAWLEGREESAGWSHVWEKLVDLRGDLPAEIDRAAFLMQGHAWLEGREESAGWSHVWRKLVDLRGDLPAEIDFRRLIALGHGWLLGRETADGWAHVWQEILSHDLHQGWEWLRQVENMSHESWTFVWQALEKHRFEPPVGEPTLDEFAWQWLQRPENVGRGAWDKIWETCFNAGYRELPFLNAGSDWVRANGELPQAYGLAIILLGVTRARSVGWVPSVELIGWVRDWLAVNHSHPSWSYLWGKLWSIDRSLNSARLATGWLNSGPPEKRAGWAIGQLARSREPEVLAELRGWLDAHGSSPLTPIVRQTLGITE